MGSTSVEAPQPTAEEIAIQREQLELMRQSRAEQAALRPFILQSLRLIEPLDTPGVLRRMTDEEFLASLSPTERTAEENLRLAQERERKALAGELPLTEAGQQRKREEFAAFKEQMARAGNPITGDTPESATAQTTAGIQGLKAFQERWGLVEEAERRGELSSGTSAVLQRMGVATDIGGAQRAGLLQFPAGPAALAQGYGGLLQPYQYQRALQFQATRESSANRLGLLQGAGQLAGTIAGAYLLSARKYKKDVKPVTRTEERKALQVVRGLDLRTYRYKSEPATTPKRIGLMADTAPVEIVTPDREGLDIGRTIGLLTAATRALARRAERRA